MKTRRRRPGRPRKPRPSIEPPTTPTDGAPPPAAATTREVMRAARSTASLDHQLKAARARVRELEHRRRTAAKVLRDLAADVAGDTITGVDRGSLP